MGVVRKLTGEVIAVRSHGDQVFSVEIRPECMLPAFRPGQFLHLALDAYDPSACWPESRVFSIASSPRERGCLRLLYSVKGVFTTRMANELVVGRRVWLKLPYGDFVVDGTRGAVLIAGGTGLSAFLGFMDGLEANHSAPVMLLYGARQEHLLIERDRIEAARERVPVMRTFFFAEHGGGPGVLAGRVSPAVLRHCELDETTVYYLAGPPPMITVLREALYAGGVASGRVRVDAWE